MEYRFLPDGQKISTIGIGVGNYGYENVSSDEIERIFQTAFDGGVNFIDTCMSVSYPAEAIARAIHGKRASLIMQNHLCVGYPHGEYQHLLKLSEVKDAFAMELKKYGTDYSDIGTIHFIDEESDLRRLIDTGVIDYSWKVHLLRSLYCGKPSVIRQSIIAWTVSAAPSCTSKQINLLAHGPAKTATAYL